MVPFESIIIGNSSGKEKGGSARLQLMKQIIGERIFERDLLHDWLIWKDNAFRFNIFGIRYWLVETWGPWITLRNPADICVHNDIQRGSLTAIENMQLSHYPLVQSIAAHVSSMESQPWPVGIRYDVIGSSLGFSRQFIGFLRRLRLYSGTLNRSLRETQGVFGELPLPNRNGRLNGSHNDQQEIEYGLKTLNRCPPTPKSRVFGICLLLMGISAAAIGTYYSLRDNLWLMLFFWAWTFVLIHLGLDEISFGDAPLSSFLGRLPHSLF